METSKKKIKDSWTRDGVFFVKQTNDVVSRVNTDEELYDLAEKLNLDIILPESPYSVSTDEEK